MILKKLDTDTQVVGLISLLIFMILEVSMGDNFV